jgi:hypothetical protein
VSDLEALLRDPKLATSDPIACPHCTAMISILVGRNADGETTVDVTHPQPPCREFRLFVDRLFGRHRN